MRPAVSSRRLALLKKQSKRAHPSIDRRVFPNFQSCDARTPPEVIRPGLSVVQPFETKTHMADDMSANPSRDDFAALLEEAFGGRDFAEGTVVHGKVVAIEKDFAIIDVGL